MGYIMATGAITVAAGVVCIFRSITKRTSKPPAAFICRKWGEHYCQYELPN
jgi:hypothetical protein